MAPAVVLDPATYPHLFETILSSLSGNDILSLRAVSSAFLVATDAFLAPHIELSFTYPSGARIAPGLTPGFVRGPTRRCRMLPVTFAVVERRSSTSAGLLRCLASLRSTRAVTCRGSFEKMPTWFHSMILPTLLQSTEVLRSLGSTYIPLVAPTLAAFPTFEQRMYPTVVPDNNLWRFRMHASMPFIHQGTIKLVLNLTYYGAWLPALAGILFSVDTFHHPPSLTRVVIFFHRHPARYFDLPSVHELPRIATSSQPTPTLLGRLIDNALAPLLRGVRYTLVDVDTWSPQWLHSKWSHTASLDDYDDTTKLSLQEQLLRTVARRGGAQGWSPSQVRTAQDNLEFVSSAQYRSEVGATFFAYETREEIY